MDLKRNPRLDEWLVEAGHYTSRARARDAILRGCIKFGKNTVKKPATKVADPDAITIEDDAIDLVSRAAIKLDAALKETRYSPQGKVCLDLGASTGGFCQILLDQGASQVYAIDVGHDQMDDRLLDNPQLVNHEGVNARELTLEHLDHNAPEFITCDVSFISLKLALPPALDMAEDGAIGIFLIKPQFEVGKDRLGKGGVVRDENLLHETANGLRDWFNNVPSWRVTHFMPSPIHGGDGNQEFLMAGIKDG